MDSNLSNRTFSAAYWGTAGAGVKLVLQLGSQIVLARLLGPEQYGLFALGAIIIGLSHLFSDVGITYELIRRPNLKPIDIRYIVAWQLGLGATVAGIVFLGSGLFAALFNKPESEDIIKVMSVLCLLSAITAPSLNILKRGLKSKHITISQISSFAIGYLGVGIPMALEEGTAWSLVFAWITQSSLYFVFLYAGTRHPLIPVVRHPDSDSISRLGALVFLTNVANWMTINIDRALIGRFMSKHEVGLYATSYNLLYTPAAALLDALQPIFLAATTKMGSDPQAAKILSFRALLAAIALYLLPVFMVASFVAETFVSAMYGQRWIDAAPLLTPLALAMPLFFVSGLITPLLWTTGQPATELKIQGPMALLWTTGCLIAVQFSALAVAWTVFGLCLLRAAAFIFLVTRMLKLPFRDLWVSVRGGLLSSSITTGVVAFVDRLSEGIHPLLHLGINVAAGAATLVLLLHVAPKLISTELLELNRRAISRLPRAFQNVLMFLHQPRSELRSY